MENVNGRLMVKSSSTRMLIAGIVPVVLLGWIYHWFLGHRSDYLGHFLAGYGGTLGLLMVCVVAMPARDSSSNLARQIFFVTLISIGIGAVCEATIFRIAIFDRVDFCNQSIGAVLAGFAALVAVSNSGLDSKTVGCGLAIAAITLAAGFHYAFA